MSKNTITVNLLAGPGSGKSTIAAGLFHELKMKSFECELVTEFAKYLTWEENFTALEHQYYVTAKQMHREYVVHGKVDVLITDSPTIIGLLYYKEPNVEIKTHFENFVVSSFKSKRNLNFFLERKKKYNPNGRNQTEEEAIKIDEVTKQLLTNWNIPFETIPGQKESIDYIIQKLTTLLKE